VELGGGFIAIRRPDGASAILVPHLQSAGVAGMITPHSVNARNDLELTRWLQEWGFPSDFAVAQVDQVHGAAVARVSSGELAVRDADGLWSDSSNVILTVKAADCAPVWLADMSSSRFALAHAGWRGVAAGIVASVVEALRGQGTNVEELTVAIGPHLQSCCFEVGPEVARHFARIEGAVLGPERLVVERRRSDSVALDLGAAIRAQLHALGVRSEQIFAATACTRCHPETLHSYRRNGSGGPLMAAIAVRRE
jgi:YfiH family protein